MEMLNKKLKSMLFIFLILFCIAAVNAEEIDNIDLESIKTVNVESVNDGIVAIDDSDEKVGNFSALNKTINSENDNGKEISLEMNYTYDNKEDILFKNGINITKSMTINGNGFTINGNNTARIFNINKDVTLILKNINLMNANAVYGGVINNIGNLTLINSTFYNNSATYSNYNSVIGGGAIYNAGNITITDSIFSDNSASGYYSTSGGAIYNIGNLTVYNSTFNNNTAGIGGAIYSTSNLVVNRSIFNNNTGSSGGSIYSTGNLTTINTIFENHTIVGYGGAIYSRGNLTTINSNFTNNNAEDDGGAVYSRGNLTIINSTFNNNSVITSVNCYGGAICNYGNLTVINSIFHNNIAVNIKNPGFNETVTGWTPSFGGAIYNEGNLTLIKSTFENSFANDGGAISIKGNLTVIDSAFNNNLGFVGAAIYNRESGVVNITNSSFNGNSAASTSGAISTNGILNIRNSNFTNNNARMAIGALESSEINIINSNFINNTSPVCGAVAGGDRGTIVNSTFSDNSAIMGGAVMGMGNLNITDSTFKDNHANLGGAISNVGNITINGSKFINNNATKGGAVLFSNLHDFYYSYYSTIYKDYPEVLEEVLKEIEDELPELEKIYKGSMKIINSYFEKNSGEFGDDIYASNNMTVSNNSYTKDSFANIYTNNTIVNSTIVNVLGNLTNNTLYITSPDGKFTLNATVFVDGASVAGYDLIITDGTNNYTAVYKGHGLYEVAEKILADFKVKTYTAIINNATSHPNYIVNNGTVINNKKNVTVKVELDDVRVGENITGNITLTDENGEVANITGEVTVKIDNETFTVNITEGKGKIDHSHDLQPGNHTMNVEFEGNEEYDPSNTTVDFEVSKGNPDLDVNIKDVEGNLTMDIIMNPDINGNVTVIIDNNTFVVEIRNGSGSLDLSDLESGVHNFTVSFEGNDNYNPAETAGTFDTNGIVLEVDYLTKYYGNVEKLNIRLRDALGNPIANQNITIKINGVTYTRTTDENGTILMSINLIPGVYETEVSYENMTEIVNVTILSTIESEDLIKYFKNGSQYYAKFLDVDGTPLANTNVTFNIHGVFYTRTTDADGIAKLNINLNPGEYIITAWNPVNTESKSNIITVLSTIFGENVVKFYRNGTQYYARVLDANGNPLANANVTFNIHGVFYNRTSNEEGIVKLNINLNPGEYIITAWNLWNGEAKSNNITVYNVVLSENLEMTTSARKPFKVTILGEQGKPLANAKVSFNIHGVFYYKTTDANGEVSLNINLVAGKYIITTYYNEYAVSNTIIVK